MRKRVTTTVLALLFTIAPSACAAESVALPSIPAHPTVEQLQQLIVQLTQMLSQLLAQAALPTHVSVAQPSAPVAALTITAGGTIIGTNIPFNTATTIAWSSQGVRPGSCAISAKLPNGATLAYRNSGSVANDNGSATTGNLAMSGIYTYTLRCEKTDGTGDLSAQAAFNVLEAPVAVPATTISVAYGNLVRQGDSLQISWQTQNAPAGANAMVWLDSVSGVDMMPLTGSTLKPTTSSIAWKVPVTIPTGIYKVRAYVTSADYCYPAFTAPTCASGTTQKPLATALGALLLVTTSDGSGANQ